MAREVTPPDLTITPRDRRFGRSDRTERWWLAGNPYGSALYDALSITFPKGEAFFVESVRAFRDGADPKLAEEIKAFVRDRLSAYAYPRLIEFVDDLPKTLTGKIRRSELRQAGAGAGEEEASPS